MAELDTARRRISAAARNRDEAIRARQAAREELGGYCREGHSLGLSVAEIAKLAGLSRQAVYDLLDRRDS
jgi:hypothetical protein